jgi:hypothetical protein
MLSRKLRYQQLWTFYVDHLQSSYLAHSRYQVVNTLTHMILFANVLIIVIQVGFVEGITGKAVVFGEWGGKNTGRITHDNYLMPIVILLNYTNML